MNANGDGFAQLLSESGTNIGPNGILSWVDVFKGFGEFRDDISQLRLKQTDNPGVTTGDIIGNIKVNPGDPNILDITMDTATFPTSTIAAVDAVVDPQANFPGDGTITAAQDGDRYLLTKAVAGGSGWAGSGADVHDIIQYSVGTGQWDIVFDASALNPGGAIQYVTNTTTLDRLKYDGTQWVNAFEGTYNPGFWRIYL